MLSNKIFYLKDNEFKLDDELKGIINSNTNIVIKVGEKDEIIYEWNIIKNLRKYIPKGIPKYISSPKKYNNKMALLLPFYEYNSIYKAIWDNENLIVLKSLIVQVFIHMFLSYHYFGFIYRIKDNMFFNKILINETKDETINYLYQSSNESYKRILIVDTNGYHAIMTDFENSYYVHKKDGIKDYWESIYNLIESINNLFITMHNYKIIINFIKKQIEIRGDYDNSIKLYNLLLNSKYELSFL